MRKLKSSNEVLMLAMRKQGFYEQAESVSAYKRKKITELIFNLCDVTGVSELALKSASRKRNLVEMRQLFFAIVWNTPNIRIGCKNIGLYMGGRDHTTVLYGKDVHKALYEVDKDLKERTDNIIEKIQSKVDYKIYNV